MLRGYPIRNEDNSWRDLGGEVVILNQDGTEVCLLNKTAAQIWTLADGTRDMAAIASGMLDRFDVSFREAMDDVQEMCAQFLQTDLIELLHHPVLAAQEQG
jgi:hypothetical protein